MRKDELREELKDVKVLYIVGIHYSRNYGWTRFRVWYAKDGELRQLCISPYEHDVPATWVPLGRTSSGELKGGYFQSYAVGMDRVFEIVYDVGWWLYGNGYRFCGVFLNS